MATDDLNAPLGQNAKTRSGGAQAAGRACRKLLAGAARLCSCWPVAAWALFVDDPLGGEPIAVVATALAGRSRRSAGDRRRGAEQPAPPRRPGRRAAGDRGRADAAAPPPGTKTVTIIDGSTGKRQEVADPGPATPTRRAPLDQRAARDDRGTARSRRSRPTARGRPTLYARAVQAAAGQDGRAAHRHRRRRARHQRQRHRRGASHKLPAPVTLAFAPYGADLETLVAQRARATATRCCCRRRWSRSTIPTTIPARRRC